MGIYSFKVVWCPVCNQGWVEIVKDKKTNELFLCCSECETEWLNPEEIKSGSGTHGKFGQTMAPRIEEIKLLNWHRYIKID